MSQTGWAWPAEEDWFQLLLQLFWRSMIIAYGETYQEFVVLLKKTNKEKAGVPVVRIDMQSHCSAFIAAISQQRDAVMQEAAGGQYARPDGWFEQLLLTMAAMKSPWARDELASDERLRFWNLSWNLPAIEPVVAARVVYDPASRSLALRAHKGAPNPGDFPNHLQTTSEMLEFAVATIRERPVVWFGDVGWFAKSYRLEKLVIDVLDGKGINSEKIRCNAADEEDWDYVNLDYDAEIQGFER